MGFNHRYDLVKGDEDNKDDLQPQPQHTLIPARTPWWKFLLCNLFAAIVGAGVMFVIAPGSSETHSSGSAAASVATATTTVTAGLVIPTSAIVAGKEKTPNMPIGTILDCGGNPAEARAKDCVFDVMMQDWVPKPCYDSVLTEKYLAQGNWTWYGDGDGKTTISDEDMRKGEHGAAWMSTSYHKAHCVFSWMKIIRALRNRAGISQELLSYDHVMHCAHGALKESSTDEGLGVQAPTNYAKCALYETWKQEFIPDKHDSTQR